MVDRVAVFVDYQNIFMAARQCFHIYPYGPTEGQAASAFPAATYRGVTGSTGNPNDKVRDTRDYNKA